MEHNLVDHMKTLADLQMFDVCIKLFSFVSVQLCWLTKKTSKDPV